MLYLLIAVAAACFVIERIWTGWTLPKVSTWPVRVVVVNLIQIGVVFLAGVTWEKYLATHSFFHLPLGPIAGGLLAYFVSTFVFYWWHRFRHTSDFLWRGFHQIHHSPQRLEVITSFYKHPLEMIANSILGSLIVYTLLGLSPGAGAVYTACCALGEFFYHTNIRTPRWIGYIFQRPEMHRIHHEKDKHRNNYGDIVWWDMLFGTYDNPPTWDAQCGFTPEREERLGAMLAFRDVHAGPPRTVRVKSLLTAALVVLTLPARAVWAAETPEAREAFRAYEQELLAYPLSIPKLEAVMTTLETLKARSTEPDLVAFRRRMSMLGNSEVEPLAPRVLRLAERSPTIVAVAKANGLTPYDLIYSIFALSYLRFSAGAEARRPGTFAPDSTTMANIKLVREHTERMNALYTAIDDAWDWR